MIPSAGVPLPQDCLLIIHMNPLLISVHNRLVLLAMQPIYYFLQPIDKPPATHFNKFVYHILVLITIYF